MSSPFNELSERLLRAGVAPRHVRRYLAELNHHLADLAAEELLSGLSPAQSQAAALARLGSINDLAAAMLNQPQFQAFSCRAPFAVFGLAPLLALAAAWSLALFILWSGWHAFLPGQPSPFVNVYGVAAVYFGIGRMIYFCAPVLTGWTIAFLAVRQRLTSLWPLAGLFLVAVAGAALQVHATRPTVPGAIGGVSMGLAVSASAHSISGAVSHAAAILALAALPWLIGRLRNGRLLPA
jgi:hypothetical protein